MLALGLAACPAAQLLASTAQSRPITVPDTDGDTPEHRRERELLADAQTAARRPTLSAAETERLLASLRDPETYWTFLIAPDTPYLERCTAAENAHTALPISCVPRLVTARHELELERRLHGFGLRAHPRSAIAGVYSDSRGNVPRHRILLGSSWEIPPKLGDYPLTWAEQVCAPWPWQVEQALERAFSEMLPRGDAARAKSWLDVTLTMPWTSDEEATLFVDTSRWAMSTTNVAVLARWRAIALGSGRHEAAQHVGSNLSEVIRRCQDPHGRELGELIAVDILRESTCAAARVNVAYGLSSWGWYPGTSEGSKDQKRERKERIPATAILALARDAIGGRGTDASSEWNRYYDYAASCIECLDNPPFAIDRRMDPQSPEVHTTLERFTTWFRSHESELEQAAVGEKARLDADRQLLLDAMNTGK
jgi:hypothetical protein